MDEYSWRDVAARYYRQAETFLLGQVKCYSMHFMYRYDGSRYVISRVAKEDHRVPFELQFDILELLCPYILTVQQAVSTSMSSRVPWVDLDSHYWFVRSFVDHDQAPDWRCPDLIRDAASQLARIHEIGKMLPSDLGHARSDLAPYHWPVWTFLEERDAVIVDMTMRNRTTRDIETVRRSLDRLASEATQVELGLVGVTHQDYRPENILVKNGRVVAIIDWDLAHEDYYLCDAVLGALHMASRWPLECAVEVVDLFVETYLKLIDVKADDRATSWMCRYVATRNLAMSKMPDKWCRIQQEVEYRKDGPTARWLSMPSL